MRQAILTLAVALAFAGSLAAAADAPAVNRTVPVGAIMDLSGPTRGVSSEYAEGIKACVRYLNDSGGVGGREIELRLRDYGYDESRARSAFKELAAGPNPVIAIQSWGTHDTCALRKYAEESQVVILSASYAATLADVSRFRYNFFAGTSYENQIRLAIKFAKARGAERVVFMYPDTAYGKTPIPAGKQFADELGLAIGPDVILPLDATCAVNPLKRALEFKPDFIWLGGTAASTAVVLSDAAKLDSDVKFVVNCWGLNESLLDRVPRIVEDRVFGIMPAVPYGADVPGMARVLEYAGDGPHSLHFVKGWVSMMILGEGLSRAVETNTGPVTGDHVRDALESLRDFSTGFLTPPITFTAQSHLPNYGASIAVIENGKLKVISAHYLDQCERVTTEDVDKEQCADEQGNRRR